MKRLPKQAGDTIIEVLIAMTVAAGVLGASYTVVSRTMANARQAQEHTEALQVANKQIEFIATLAASTSANDLYNSPVRYKCADKDTGGLVRQPQLQRQYLGYQDKYENGCISDSPVQYLTAFEYVIDAGNPNVKFFRVYVTWPSVTGDGNDQVSLVYKAYQP